METFAVVGCGRMGERRARTVQEHPQTSLVAVSDVDAQKAKNVAEQHDCDASTDVEATVRRDDVSHVFICTPNKFHLPITRSAARAGTNVICEKPLARTPDEAKEMVNLAVDNDVHLKVSSNLRYFPSVQKAKELFDDNVIGDLYHARGWIGNDGWQLEKGWFGDEELIGGGTLLDNGSHLLDIYRWILGEAEECVGFTDTLEHDIPIEDTALGLFRFDSGAYGFLQSSWTEWDGYMYLELVGSEGYIRVDNRHPESTVTLGEPGGFERTYEYTKLPPTSYGNELDDYLRALDDGERPVPTGFDGMRAVQMAHGVYDSSRSGQMVSLRSDSVETLRSRMRQAETTGSAPTVQD